MKAAYLLLLISLLSGVAIASSEHLKCESDGTLIVASSKPMEKLSCNLAVRIIQIKDPLAAVEVFSENPAASMGRYAIASDRIQNQRLRCHPNEPAILGIALDNNPIRQMSCGQEVELIRDDGLSAEIDIPGEQQHWYVARDHVDRTDEAGNPIHAQPATAPVPANAPPNTQPPKPQGSAIAKAGKNTLHVTWANKSSSEETMRVPGTPSTTYTTCQNRVSTPASGPGQPAQISTVWGTDCRSTTYPGQAEMQTTLVTSYYFVAGWMGDWFNWSASKSGDGITAGYR